MDNALLDWSKAGECFADPDKAREYLERLRWGKSGPVCPHCGGSEPYALKPKATSQKPGRKGLYKCKACRKQFTVTVGTVFEDSHIPLNKWLQAIYLITASKKGISSHQLHRMLGVTYKSAWFMSHRLRYAMTQDFFASKLSGTVEVDEAYIGGKRKGGVGRFPADGGRKAAVAVLVERGGKARAFPMEMINAHTMDSQILRHVEANKSRLMTDEATHYGMRTRIGGIPREAVEHRRGEFVRGDANTNTAEGFFSLLKRGIVGTFHHVGKGHLAKYVSEFEFRYNNRTALGVNDAQRAAALVLGAEGKRLTYKQPEGDSQN